MRVLILLGAGGFLGTILRYMLSQFIQLRFLSGYPYGTLVVNIIGCFAIGLFFALSERINLDQEWRLFFATGICGGFTTFSTFSYELFGQIRDGQFWYASVYIISSVLLGVLATMAGYSIVKLI